VVTLVLVLTGVALLSSLVVAVGRPRLPPSWRASLLALSSVAIAAAVLSFAAATSPRWSGVIVVVAAVMWFYALTEVVGPFGN
jgi:hypothetical protein